MSKEAAGDRDGVGDGDGVGDDVIDTAGKTPAVSAGDGVATGETFDAGALNAQEVNSKADSAALNINV
jgi:hypothetical protein